jgi:hypothetical protein
MDRIITEEELIEDGLKKILDPITYLSMLGKVK